MTTTLDDVTARKKRPPASAGEQAAAELVRMTKEQGLSLTGPDGLLKQLTKTVLETALNEELTEHLGYEKNDPAGVGSGNIRNGTRSKTVLTENTGSVSIEVPRDRTGTFEPQIVKKRQRRLSGVDEIVLSLYAKGLTTGEISAHFAETGQPLPVLRNQPPVGSGDDSVIGFAAPFVSDVHDAGVGGARCGES
jgi:putative transposase